MSGLALLPRLSTLRPSFVSTKPVSFSALLFITSSSAHVSVVSAEHEETKVQTDRLNHSGQRAQLTFSYEFLFTKIEALDG